MTNQIIFFEKRTSDKNDILKKNFKVKIFTIDPKSVKQHEKWFLSAPKEAVAIDRHYFYTVAVALLLNLIIAGAPLLVK